MPRILIKIYQIPVSSLLRFNKELTQKVTTSQYLSGVDWGHIYNITSSSNNVGLSGQIKLTSDNLPTGFDTGIDVAKHFFVFEKGEDKWVEINGVKFYIPNHNYNLSDVLQKEIFEFYINPERVTPSFTKLQTEVRTLGGFEIQHWGNQLSELKVDAKTGGLQYKLVNGKKELLTNTDTIIDSYAWQKIASLRSIYEKDQNRRNKEVTSLLGITYMDGLYVGYFTNFTGPIAESEKPYIMTFNFTFKVQETVYTSGEIVIPGNEV